MNKTLIGTILTTAVVSTTLILSSTGNPPNTALDAQVIPPSSLSRPTPTDANIMPMTSLLNVTLPHSIDSMFGTGDSTIRPFTPSSLK